MLNQLNNHYPVRYTVLGLCAFGLALALFSLVAFGVGWLALLCFGALLALGVYDMRQSRHAILRNYPVIGHLRFALEYIRPEMRQYFIESDREAVPFSRAQRSSATVQRGRKAQDVGSALRMGGWPSITSSRSAWYLVGFG